VDLGTAGCLQRLGTLSQAQAGNRALTRGCRDGGHLLRGGDQAEISKRLSPLIAIFMRLSSDLAP
jgi:hypothetical protein